MIRSAHETAYYYLKINRCTIWVWCKGEPFDFRPPPCSTPWHTFHQFYDLNKSPCPMMLPPHPSFCGGNSYYVVIWSMARWICSFWPQFLPWLSCATYYWTLLLFLSFRRLQTHPPTTEQKCHDAMHTIKYPNNVIQKKSVISFSR